MSFPLRAAALAALVASAATQAVAQQAPVPTAPPASAPASPSAAGPSADASRRDPSPLAYRSSFEGYRPYADQPLEPWRAANDRVRDIGGWKAYAREAQEPAAKPGTTPAPPAPASGPSGHPHH